MLLTLAHELVTGEKEFIVLSDKTNYKESKRDTINKFRDIQ